MRRTSVLHRPPRAAGRGRAALAVAFAGVLARALGACADAPTTPQNAPPAGPRAEAAAATEMASAAASTGLSWLAPLGGAAPDSATFDATATPVIEVCAWTGVACAAPPVARFAARPTAGAQPLAVDSAAGQYEASWSLLSPTLTTRTTYRIRVLQGRIELGALLVDAVRGRWAAVRDDGTLAPLAAAGAVPIRFHLARSACTAAWDRDGDGDGLPDCVETNTGRFAGVTSTGTDPNNPDTDGDGLPDGDEVAGTVAGLDLPRMGVSPVHQDVLLEYDWFNDANECAAHSHRPRPTALDRVSVAFANAPVRNPDGTTGVHLVHDYGQGGVFTGGNLIADADGVIAGGVNNPDYVAYKAANFAANRRGYFHYVLLPHRYGVNSTSSGQAQIDGSDLIVSLYCFGSDGNVANTIMHELGHNLGLRHGGFENQNYKPNYNSVMNYMYQFPGIDTDCTPPGNGLLSYSVGTRPDLDENNVDERNGVCGPGGPPWDWNGNGVATDFGYSLNLNPADGTALSVLRDYNDWANLHPTAVTVGLRAAEVSPEVVSCVNVPPDVPPAAPPE